MLEIIIDKFPFFFIFIDWQRFNSLYMYLHNCDEYYTVFHGSTGQPATVKVVVKMPENYPVDLYYLMDLSGSMVEDLKKFPALGESIGLQQ